MSHDEGRDLPALDAEAKRLQDTVRQLVLMKETGPKSAAWHRARVQMIWRLHRRLERRAAGSDESPGSLDQAEQRQQPKSEDDRA
ncbi:MAG TPA: hypothetical protein VGD58_25990 [Herpetosiphonaceae bacterium]